MKICAQCGSKKFGLVRYSRGTKQFCSIKCRKRNEAELDGKLAAAKRRWLAFLARGSSRSP